MREAAQAGPITNACRFFIRAGSWIAGAGIALLMVPTVVDVTHRKLLGPSIPGILEYSEVGLVIVVYLAMAATLHRRAHIFTPILTDRLPVGAARIVRIAGQVLVWAALAIMVYGSAQVAIESVAAREYRFGLTQVPIWPAKLIVPIGLFMLLVELTLQIWEEVAHALSGKTHAG